MRSRRCNWGRSCLQETTHCDPHPPSTPPHSAQIPLTTFPLLTDNVMYACTRPAHVQIAGVWLPSCMRAQCGVVGAVWWLVMAMVGGGELWCWMAWCCLMAGSLASHYPYTTSGFNARPCICFLTAHALLPQTSLCLPRCKPRPRAWRVCCPTKQRSAWHAATMATSQHGYKGAASWQAAAYINSRLAFTPLGGSQQHTRIHCVLFGWTVLSCM